MQPGIRTALPWVTKLAIAATGALLMATAVEAKPMTDAAVKKEIIRQSVASYPGNCACPYNTMSNGRSCGGRSAHSRGGGYAPKYYPSDVSAAEVKAYRSANGASR